MFSCSFTMGIKLIVLMSNVLGALVIQNALAESGHEGTVFLSEPVTKICACRLPQRGIIVHDYHNSA